MIDNARSLVNYYLKFGPLFKQKLRHIIALKQLDNNRLLEIQNEKFLEVFRHAIKHSKFYKKLYTKYDISEENIKSIHDITKLPVLTKSDIKDHIDEIYTGSKFSKVKGYTSGTSGSPLMVYRTYASVLEENAYIWAHRHHFGYRPGMKTVSLRGDLDRNKMISFDKFSNTLYLSSYNISEKNAAWYFDKIQSFAPYAILAYPSSLDNLANLFRAVNIELQIPYTFTSSETLYENQRTKIEAVFNTKIYDWYGNAERTIAIEQRQNYEYYELPLYSFNEFKENATITTGLINANFPLIRYQVTDAIKHTAFDTDLDKSRFRIEEIQGRNDDVLLLPDGTKIGRLGFELNKVKNIDYAQFVQTDKEKFVLNLVVTNNFTADDEKRIVKNLEHRIGNSMPYEIKKIKKEDIILSKSGKFKLVVNQICNFS